MQIVQAEFNALRSELEAEPGSFLAAAMEAGRWEREGLRRLARFALRMNADPLQPLSVEIELDDQA